MLHNQDITGDRSFSRFGQSIVFVSSLASGPGNRLAVRRSFQALSVLMPVHFLSRLQCNFMNEQGVLLPEGRQRSQAPAARMGHPFCDNGSAHTRTHTRVYVYVYIYIYIHLYIYAYVHIYIFIGLYKYSEHAFLLRNLAL